MIEEVLTKTNYGTIEIKVQDGEVLHIEQRPIFRRVINAPIVVYS